VRRPFARWFAAVLLAFAVGAQLVEMSGRWDRTLADAGDEAAVVAVVLCVGVAFAAAAALKARMRPARIGRRIASRTADVRRRDEVSPPTVFSNSPPIPLRI